MRIAVFHNLPSGGGKRALYYHVKGLIERGHYVECWCPDTADSAYLPLQSLAREHVIPFDHQPHRLPGKAGKVVSRYWNAWARMRAMDKVCQQAAREIDAANFDLLFANSCLFFYMPFIVRYVHTPKVLYLGEPYRALYEADPALPWVGRPDLKGASAITRAGRFISDQLHLQALRIQARREWLNAHACEMILVNSYYSRESVLRAYGCDAKVCYLGVDTALFRNLQCERANFVVGLGTFCKAKDVELAIQAIALLDEPRPALVWIANGGVDAYVKAMTELAQSSGVTLQIKMRISDEEILNTLNRAALMLYTSHLEPFGLAPLEANACGTPVVAVAEGGLRETIKNGINGFLVDRDPEAVAKAIKKLLHDTALARRIGETATKHVKQEWGLERSLDRLEAHFYRLVQAARPSTDSSHAAAQTNAPPKAQGLGKGLGK